MTTTRIVGVSPEFSRPSSQHCSDTSANTRFSLAPAARSRESAQLHDHEARSWPTASSPEANPAPASRPIRVLIVDTAISFGGTLVVARNLLKHLDSSLVDASLLSACSDGFVSTGFAGNAKARLLAPRVNYVTLENWKLAIRKRIAWAPIRWGAELTAMVTGILANVPYLVRLVLLYRKLRLDVVHVNNYSMEPVLAARFSASLWSTTCTGSFHPSWTAVADGASGMSRRLFLSLGR